MATLPLSAHVPLWSLSSASASVLQSSVGSADPHTLLSHSIAPAEFGLWLLYLTLGS